MRVAYTTIYDAQTTTEGFSSYNGVGYHMGRALRSAGLDLDYLGPLHEKYAYLFYAKQLVYQRCLHKVYNRHREPLACRDYSRQIARLLRQEGPYDAVLSSLSCGSQPVAYLDTDLPLVIWTDSTLASAVGFYPDLVPSRAVWSNIESGLANEREALSRAKLVIYSSEWARREAIAQYQLDPASVKVVPFGANDESELDRQTVGRLIQLRPENVCRLLFVGMDWHRKGGDVALRTAEILHQRGLRVELRLVGSAPSDGKTLPDYVHPMGLITRRTPQGAATLDELFSRSHFLILASRADASPHVLVEANSRGVPCAASNVGGIPSIINEGVNGRMFSPDVEPSQYADWIGAVYANPDEYRRLALSSFEEYKSRLNWTTSAQRVATLIDQLVHSPLHHLPLHPSNKPRMLGAA